MNPIERVVRRFDRWQQGCAPAGFVVGVIKKFGDDRGGQLAALVAFAGFLAFFPLMLVVVTVTAFIAQRQPVLADRIRSSAIAQFPVVGAELADGDRPLPGNGLGLGVGLAGLLWGGFGVTGALQYAFHEVWHVPHKARPPFVNRMLRGLAVLAVIGTGLLASATLGLVGTFIRDSRTAGAVGLIAATMVSVGLYLVVFWLLSPKTLGVRELLPGAITAAVGWQALQLIGIRLVSHQLRRSSQLYGAIGAALGLLWFLAIATQILMYSVEISVVRAERLWPRSIVQPPLTQSDVALLTMMAKQEERRPEMHVAVRFDAACIGGTADGATPLRAPVRCPGSQRSLIDGQRGYDRAMQISTELPEHNGRDKAAERSATSTEPSLLEILARYADEGFDADAFAADDGMLRCGSCSSLLSPDHLDVHSIRRLEGQSDPADMVGVVAIICPVCDAHTTAVLKYGPEASPSENAIWHRTNDARSSDVLSPDQAPGEGDATSAPSSLPVEP